MTKILTGRVLSTKMDKTVIVMVERRFRHPLYKKVIRRHKKYFVDNQKLELKVGDSVVIKESRPISKNKHFKVIEKVKSSKLKVKAEV